MKKKAIKLATSTAIAATAFVAAAPANQADAAVNVDQLVQDAQNAGTVLKWAISVEGSADGVTRPWAQYNNAKEAIAKAEAAIKGASFSDKLKYEARLTDPKIQVKRAQAYIDAITSSEKIKDLTANLNSAISSNDLDKVEAAYHKATAEYRKQTVLLDRVYGQSTRDQIRDAVKPALEKLVASVKNEVTVHMLANAANADVKASRIDDAAKKLTEAQSILDANVLKWETALQKSVTDVENAIPLKVISVSSDNKNTVTVKFSKAVPAVLPAGQFVFNNGLQVQSATVSADRKTVTLTTTTQAANKNYSLSYQGVSTGLSFTTPANPTDSTIVVDATDRARLEVGQTRTYTVTLKNDDGTPYVGSVNIRLFSDADRTAVPTAAVLTSVNGSNTGLANPKTEGLDTFAAGQNWNGVTSTDGKVTFTVTVPNGSATDAVVPFVVRDVNGDATPNYSTDKFVKGGLTNFYALAADGVKNVSSLSTSDYIDVANDYLVADNLKYKWDDNDKFYIQGSEVSLANFESALSTGDSLTIVYDDTKANSSSWNIVSNVTLDSSLTVTNPSKVVTYDDVNYRLTGTGQAGNKVQIFRDTDDNNVFTFGVDVLVGEGTVAGDGNWVVNAANLNQNAANNLIAVQFAPNSSALSVSTLGVADRNVEDVYTINQGKFTFNTVTHTDNGSANIGIGDVLTFTFDRAAYGHVFKEGTGTIVINDGSGKTATLTVKTNDTAAVTVTGITSESGFNAATTTYTIQSATGFKNQDELNLNLADSTGKSFTNN